MALLDSADSLSAEGPPFEYSVSAIFRHRPPGGTLRVAGVDPERGFSGGETQVMGLTLELRRHGHQAEILCDRDGELWRRARAEGLACQSLRVRNSIDLKAAMRLRGLLSRGAYDVVHFHTARAHALAPFVRGLAPVRIVTRRMDYRPNRLFARYLYNQAVDGVIAISRGVAAALESGGVRPARLRIIPSGVDCTRFAPPSASARAEARARFGLREADIAVGVIGALTLRKGQRFFIEAMLLARPSVRTEVNLRGFIAGDGPLAHELAASAAAASVQMLGALSDARSLLWALDIFVMPSLNEGLGIAALEAMACGLPLVVSDVGGLSEVVEQGVSGRLVAPADAPALAQALRMLAGAPQQRIAMGLAARDRAVAAFSLDAMAAQTLAFYRDLHGASL